ARIEQEATEPADRTALRLLIGALGIFPTGTLIELSTGEVAVVAHTPQHPSLYSQPRVRIVLDASGAPPKAPAQAIAIDLSQQRRRSGEPIRVVRRVVATSDDPSAASLRALAASAADLRGQATQVTPPPASPSREAITPASPGARAEEPNTRAVSWDEQAKLI